MQTIEVNVPARLKEIRKQKKLTQRKVAKRLSIGLKTYASYEEGRATPRLPLLLKLAVVYEMHSLDRLLGIETDNHGQ